MKKGKGCNLAAAIIEIILAAFLIIGGAYYLIAGSAFSTSGEELAGLGSILVIIGAVALAFGVIYLTFGILTIKYTNSDAQVYYSKKNVLLAFSIVESVIIVYFIYSVISAGDPLSFISFLIYLSATILHWVGYGLMNKGSKQYVEKPASVEVLTEEKKAEESAPDAEMYSQLTKLNELKQNGVISEEEFQSMKDKLLKK